MPKIDLPNAWQPRDYQRPAWDYLERGGKHCELIWHRRSGKDEIALHRTAVAAHERVGNYWHMLPEAAQARKAIWEAINPHTGRRRIDEAFPREIRESTREHDMMIKFKVGSTWQVVGSDNFNSLIGSPPIGIVYSEWALADPMARAILRPILRENGGWQIFITTPRGKNHAYTTYNAAKGESDAFAQKLTVRDTGAMTELEIARELKSYKDDFGPDEGEALFSQEYMCSFEAAIMGAYYGKLMVQAREAGRITRVPYEPAKPVETWWDLGIGDSTPIWFAQRINAEIRLIDYYEMSGEGLSHYAKIVKEKPYVYSRHIAPHDIEVRELGSGRSRKEIAAELGLNFEVAPNLPVDDGINAVRAMLPRCWFDEEKCKRGIDALEQYRKSYDDKLKTFRDRPLHDWTSHGSDAFRMGAVCDAPSGSWATPIKYKTRGIV